MQHQTQQVRAGSAHQGQFITYSIGSQQEPHLTRQRETKNKRNIQDGGALWAGQRLQVPSHRFSHSFEFSSMYLQAKLPRPQIFRQQGCLQEQVHKHNLGSIAGCLFFSPLYSGQKVCFYVTPGQDVVHLKTCRIVGRGEDGNLEMRYMGSLVVLRLELVLQSSWNLKDNFFLFSLKAFACNEE